MERSTLDLWVGLFVCAGFRCLLVLALKVGNMGSIGGAGLFSWRRRLPISAASSRVQR